MSAGTSIEDPYDWLEDPSSDEVKLWINEQQKTANAVIDACAGRNSLRERLAEVYAYERVGCPTESGNYAYFLQHDGVKPQPMLRRVPLADKSTEQLDSAAAEVVLDVNMETATTSLGTYEFSKDGKYLAYALGVDGSDWRTIRIRDLTTCTDTGDRVQWVKFSSIAWMPDSSGFFYCRYPEPKASTGLGLGQEADQNLHHAMYFHRLGSDQAEDVFIFRIDDEPKWLLAPEISEDGQWLVIDVSLGCEPNNRIYVAALPASGAALTDGSLDIKPLVKAFSPCDFTSKLYPISLQFAAAQYQFIANTNNDFYFRTSLDAPRYRVVRLDIARGLDAADVGPICEEVYPQTDDVLDWAVAVGDGSLLMAYMRNVASVLLAGTLVGGKLQPVELPGIGAITGVHGKQSSRTAFIKFVSYVHPGLVMSLDTRTLVASVLHQTCIPGFNPAEFEVTQDFATSKDGTQVPLFIVRKIGAAAGGRTILYGYGGFNVSLQPSFSALRLAWLTELEGTYVVANIRGGGEYGDAWHRAGMLQKKQNVFDDFIAAAEHLCSTGVTTAQQLTIMGGSNGGLLVLACMLQRPELFGAVISQVPVADMLKFHRFTIGHAWCTEYGNAEDNEADFRTVMQYSPLHNVFRPSDRGNVSLPAVMIVTAAAADHDDRVVPAHSFKMIATLQTVAGQDPVQTKPLIVRIETQAGHGAGNPTAKVLDEYADVFSFAAHMTTVSS